MNIVKLLGFLLPPLDPVTAKPSNSKILEDMSGLFGKEFLLSNIWSIFVWTWVIVSGVFQIIWCKLHKVEVICFEATITFPLPQSSWPLVSPADSLLLPAWSRLIPGRPTALLWSAKLLSPTCSYLPPVLVGRLLQLKHCEWSHL